MRILSLFDGISCGQKAIQSLGVQDYTYLASEVDKYAIKVAQARFPYTVQLGDVRKINPLSIPHVTLLLGGSPCQGFSYAGKQLNFSDPRSALFFEYVRILKEVNPTYFLLENVNMRKEYQDVISEYLGVQPVAINSNLFSAQSRLRLYWTNIPVLPLPYKDSTCIYDISEPHVPYLKEKEIVPVYSHRSRNGIHCVGGLSGTKLWLDNGKVQQRNFSQGERVYSVFGKSPTLSAQSGGTAGAGNTLVSSDISEGYRRLTTTECERLQTLDDGYTLAEGVSRSQRHKALGNGWTVKVIQHLLKGIV